MDKRLKATTNEKIMGYHIIMDSVGDRSEELMAMENFSVAPLTLLIDEEEFVDNNQLDQLVLLEKIAAAKECPRSACPSPVEYKDLFEKYKEDRIYVITGSSELTGSYNSAKLGEKLFLEKFPDAKIMIFDSKSACAGQALLAYKIIEFEKEYGNFKKVIEMTSQFIKQQDIIFTLEDITFLLKNGRLTGIKALLVTALNIVPILTASEHGTIEHMGQARGIKRALKKLKEHVIDGVEKGKKTMLVISHCNAFERAMTLKDELIALFPNLDVKVIATGGISTLYAGNGGIVVSY